MKSTLSGVIRTFLTVLVFATLSACGPETNNIAGPPVVPTPPIAVPGGGWGNGAWGTGGMWMGGMGMGGMGMGGMGMGGNTAFINGPNAGAFGPGGGANIWFGPFGPGAAAW